MNVCDVSVHAMSVFVLETMLCMLHVSAMNACYVSVHGIYA